MTERYDAGPGLFFQSGVGTLDDYDTAIIVDEVERRNNVMVVGLHDEGFCGAWFEKQGSDIRGSDSFRGATLEETAVRAQRHGVRWVEPTAHCADTDKLAELAEQIGGINYPSSALVRGTDDKERYYAALARRNPRLVPETYVCETEEDIADRMRALNAVGIAKTAEGYSSKYLITVDGRRDLTEEDRQAIHGHRVGRDAARLGKTIVQRCVGNQEFGFQALVEVTNDGFDFPWYVTTRKIMLPPHGRMDAHIYDPADQRRIELTRDLLLPIAHEAVGALLEENEHKPGLYTINLDQRVQDGPDGAQAGTWAWPADASWRWPPNYFKQLANATLGIPAISETFPALARLWAQGSEQAKEMLRWLLQPTKAELDELHDIYPSFGHPRAVLIRKAYTATGGTIVATGAEPGVIEAFYAQLPALGTRLPGPSEGSDVAAAGSFPTFCTDAPDIREAGARWVRSLKRAGIAVERDGVRYGPESQRPLAGYIED